MFFDFGGADFSFTAILQQVGGICQYQDIRGKWDDRIEERLFDNNYSGKCIVVLSFFLPGKITFGSKWHF